MANYKDIHGTNIETVTTDPSNPVNGQVWYNSTSQVLKGFTSSPVGTWATTTSLNTARDNAGGAGNSRTAALVFGGGPPPAPSAIGNTEKWNGSTWTETGNLNSARAFAGGAGTYTSAIAAGGDGYSGTAERWTGSSWANITSSPNTGHTQAGTGEDNENALFVSGSPHSGNGNSDYWNGSSWTELANINTVRAGGVTTGQTYTSALYAGGGNAPSSFLSNVEQYNSN